MHGHRILKKDTYLFLMRQKRCFCIQYVVIQGVSHYCINYLKLELTFPKNLYIFFLFLLLRSILQLTETLHTNKCTVIYYISLNFTLKCLKTPIYFDR
jgi:hypothetical protein